MSVFKTFSLRTLELVDKVSTDEGRFELKKLSGLVIKSRGKEKKYSNQMKACNMYDPFDSWCSSSSKSEISNGIFDCNSKFGQSTILIDEEDLWVKNEHGIYVLNSLRCSLVLMEHLLSPWVSDARASLSCWQYCIPKKIFSYFSVIYLTIWFDKQLFVLSKFYGLSFILWTYHEPSS